MRREFAAKACCLPWICVSVCRSAPRLQFAFYFNPSESRQFLPKREKPSLFSTLWQPTNRRPIRGLRVGSGRIQTPEHDWPFMTISWSFLVSPETDPSHHPDRWNGQFTTYKTALLPAPWRSVSPCRLSASCSVTAISRPQPVTPIWPVTRSMTRLSESQTALRLKFCNS